MSDFPICECATVWCGEGHHPECSVRVEITLLRELNNQRLALRAENERLTACKWPDSKSIAAVSIGEDKWATSETIAAEIQALRTHIAELEASNAALSARVGELEQALRVIAIGAGTANGGMLYGEIIDAARAALAANPKPQGSGG